MYNVMGRFTEQFSESQSGSGARFTVSECCNNPTNSLKSVTGRIIGRIFLAFSLLLLSERIKKYRLN
jgi:hypothetical protein